MKTATPEVRFIAIKAYHSGMPRQQVADLVGYHLNSVSRWIREYKRESRLEARERGRRPSVFSNSEREELIELINNRVDITLEEIRSHFAKNCSLAAIHKLIKKLGFTFKKKTLKASELEREDIVQARSEWGEFQNNTDSNRLVFLDETGAKTNMTRRYGRSMKGKRCYDLSPAGHWKSVTILSAIRLNGVVSSVVFQGAVNREKFDEYIENSLAPKLCQGDIVIMDNLSAHKSQKSSDIIKNKEAEMSFLPAYSPDLNPIEKMWSKVKQVLRGIKARTHEELLEAIDKALKLVSAKDAQGWFKSCGYAQFAS